MKSSRSTRFRKSAGSVQAAPLVVDRSRLGSRREVKILVVEDHTMVREGLCQLLDGYSGWKVCGEAENGKEAIEKAHALHPDLVVIDLLMPIMNGIEATKEIRRLCPTTKVVIVSMYDSQEKAAAKAGANAYVGKSRTWCDLRDAIAAVLQDGT